MKKILSTVLDSLGYGITFGFFINALTNGGDPNLFLLVTALICFKCASVIKIK